MRRLVIVDGAASLPPALASKLGGWKAYGYGAYEDTARAKHALVVLDIIRAASYEPRELHMVPAFTRNGERLPYAGVIATLEAACRGDAWVNLSWGVSMKGAGLSARYQMVREIAAWSAFQDRNPGVLLMWAAGNTGNLLNDNDEQYPQASLQSEGSISVGALEDGRPAAYSSDSDLAPMLAMDARWQCGGSSFTGTSFAAPKATAVMLAKGWKKCSQALSAAVPVAGGERKGLYTLDNEFKALVAGKVA